MQLVVNRIKNNITLSVNNLVLKYIDREAVLSVSCKSLEVFTADLNWERAFTVSSSLLLFFFFFG